VRYFIQIAVMFSDIIIALCLVIVWKELPLGLAVILTAMTFWAWHESGGFMAWQPKWIKQFLKNAKKLGL